MNWIEYHSIKELPETIWAKIAGDNPCLSADFMEIVENLHPKDSYNYAVLYDNKEVVGVIFYSIFNALSSTLMKLSIGRVLMTGTFETYGKHWWYNTSYISECVFLKCFGS